MLSKSTYRTVLLTLVLLFWMGDQAKAQAGCGTGKFRMVKGGHHCGCSCRKKCVAAKDTAAYRANYWYFASDCFGSCCWFRAGEDPSIETSLTDVYPNPAADDITVSFSLERADRVILEIYDLSGRLVATVVNEVFEGSGNEVAWDASGLDLGIYILSMKAGKYTATERIMILR